MGACLDLARCRGIADKSAPTVRGILETPRRRL